jgi:NADPH:quinone reductase-like Zn-dependent oxidoreductase
MSGEKRSLVTAASTALRMPRFNVMKQMSASKTVIGLNMLALWVDRGNLEPWIGPLQAMLDGGTIEPVVSDAVPFDKAAEAHRILAERRNIGKVVLIP